MDIRPDISPAEAARELLRRRAARDNLIDFTQYTLPNYTPDPFHRLLAAKLEAVERGDIKRLMVFAPPRHGKSELSTRRFPSWYLGRNPKKSIISASYNGDFAQTFGREVRDIIEEKAFQRIFPGVRVRGDNRSAAEWQLEGSIGQEGKYYAVGISTATTGKGAHCLPADTLVTTSIGDIPISALARLRDSVQVLGYEHTTNKTVWKNCTAFADRQADGVYRITTASGRVVEATSEHPFFANGRYVEAALLAPGDRLLRLVRSECGEDGLRVSKVGKEEFQRAFLFTCLLECQSECGPRDQSEVMQGVWHRAAPEGGTLQLEVLLSAMQEGFHGQAGLVAPGDGEGRVHRTQDLRVLQHRVQAPQQKDAGPVLLANLQGSDACFRDDGQSQSRVAEWRKSVATTTACGSSLSQDQTFDLGERSPPMRGMRIAERSRSASYQHGCNGQQVLEPGHVVREVSYHLAWCGEIKTEEDIVAMVEFVREPTTVYNISVEGTENFFANSILTHNCFLIDDPIKDQKDADSPSKRDDMWNWYRSVAHTRLEEDASIVLTLTRWHYDDIAGRAIKLMEEGRGQGWEIVSLPALAEAKRDGAGKPILNDDGTVPGDPLGRKPDEPLAPHRKSYESLLESKEVSSDRVWSALYQQRPIPEDGGLIKGSWLKDLTHPLPAKRTRVRAWDFGATLEGDWTVGLLMSRDAENNIYVEDVRRFRKSPHEVEQEMIRTAFDDGRAVQIVIPQDPGQAGVAQASNLTRKLLGYRVKVIRPTGAKATRAMPFAAQCEAGNVYLAHGMWREIFRDELSTFPVGTHDDQVDAAADAFNHLAQGSRKPIVRDW